MTVSSTNAITRLQAVNDPQGLLWLLKLDHAAFSAAPRVVNDTRNLTTLGDTYVALPFELTLPSDKDGESPRAQLRIDNIGRDLTFEILKLPPGAAVVGTLTAVYRDTPTVVEYQAIFPMTNVHIDQQVVSASLGNDAQSRRPVVLLRHDPTNTPGIFAQ